MEFRIEEGLINGAKEAIPLDKTDLREKGKCICKINGKRIGTGFFCKLKYNNSLILVLIINNHVIDDEYIEKKRN